MKKLLSVALCFGILFSCLSGLGFINADAVTYVPRLTAPTTTNKYYLHTSYGGVNECIHIGNGSCLPNCVGYAWGRTYESSGMRPNLSKGDAGTWFNYNKYGGYYPYGYTPRVGAVMCWGCYTWGHVAVVEKIEGNIVTISQSNYGGNRFEVKSGTQSQIENIVPDFQGYIYATPTGESPTATIDEIKGKVGSIDLKGWAFDKDDTSKKLEICVYVGGKPGEAGVECHKIIANSERKDVDKAYSCGTHHGFNDTVYTKLSGSQPVYVYAIDAEGLSDNVLLYSNNLTITPDNQNPTADNIRVVSTDKNSYSIECLVDDNVGISAVKFPTWSEENPDNKKWYEGTIVNGVATCTIPLIDFGNYEGKYITHVYVYDKADNKSVYPFSTTYNAPIGTVDEISDVQGGIKVRGWAFDKDDLAAGVEVHIYVGGPAGDKNAEGYIITANKLREDVDSSKKCGKNHGYEKVLPTKLTGEQPVYIYAINTGNGYNKLIGNKIVNITPSLYGDVDLSGDIDISDVTRIQQNVAGFVEFTDNESALADITRNGRVDVRDATYIQLYIAKKISEFPTGLYEYRG